MSSKFAIATFCYGSRYQKQVNRLISEIDTCSFKPTIVVVTDNIDSILNRSFVKTFDISEFNPQYKTYSDTYYSFDFSVKRYSLLAALNLGFTKIILSDADAVPNKSLFTEDYIIKGFARNSIQGQVTYNFSKEILTNSDLGKRFLLYEKYFNVSYDKNQLNFMPEDCIQFVDIETPKFYNFLRVWDECINYKNSQKLSNAPAGNIDEMCFAALHCGIAVGNNSDKLINILTPIHDKWYDSTYESTINKTATNRKKTVVSSIYELKYIEERGGGLYKGFDLLTETIRAIIYDKYNYVIYTDKSTLEKYKINDIFNYPNVEIKIRELNGEYYLNTLEPIRLSKNRKGEIYDRIFSVKNYIEVIYNKLEFLVEVAQTYNTDVCWIDAGLFGTSCHNGWRDHLKQDIVHSKNFVDKIFDKIEKEDFIALKGNHILINYEIKDKIKSSFGEYPFIVPGGLFGGKKENVLEYLTNYKNKIKEIIDCLGEYTSEQELMFLLLQNKKCHFYEFDDWDDLQKGILKIMDLFDEDKYSKASYLSYKQVENQVIDYNKKSFTEIADLVGIDKGTLYEGHRYTITYEKILKKYKKSNPVIVEIGINDTRFPGGCLKFWDIIFDQMEYYGFDIVDCSHLAFNTDKIKIFRGDQNNKNNLLEFVYKFNLPDRIDFIIDDGSHYSEHILTAFEQLYPFIKDGGTYFIEDLHAGWAERDKTLIEIDKIIEKNNFKVSSKVLENNDKLLIITK